MALAAEMQSRCRRVTLPEGQAPTPPRYIARAVEMGHRVLRTDTDVYFAEDPYPILSGPLFGQYAMVVQQACSPRALGLTYSLTYLLTTHPLLTSVQTDLVSFTCSHAVSHLPTHILTARTLAGRWAVDPAASQPTSTRD